MAYLEGFEPPTYCLEGSCSIQLSYRYSFLCLLRAGNITIKVMLITIFSSGIKNYSIFFTACQDTFQRILFYSPAADMADPEMSVSAAIAYLLHSEIQQKT